MLIRKWRGGPVRGTPASFRLNGVGGLSAPNRDGRSTAGPSTADEGAGMDTRLDSRRPALELGYRTPATVYGRGKQHKEVEQFLKMGLRPKPRAGTAGDGFGLGLVGLGLVGLWFGWIWLVLMVGIGLVGFGWLDLVGWSFLGNQFYWLNLGWPEF